MVTSVIHFVAGPEKEANEEVNGKPAEYTSNEFKELFSDTGFFEGTFSLKVKEGSKLY